MKIQKNIDEDFIIKNGFELSCIFDGSFLSDVAYNIYQNKELNLVCLYFIKSGKVFLSILDPKKEVYLIEKMKKESFKTKKKFIKLIETKRIRDKIINTPIYQIIEPKLKPFN